MPFKSRDVRRMRICERCHKAGFLDAQTSDPAPAIVRYVTRREPAMTFVNIHAGCLKLHELYELPLSELEHVRVSDIGEVPMLHLMDYLERKVKEAGWDRV